VILLQKLKKISHLCLHLILERYLEAIHKYKQNKPNQTFSQQHTIQTSKIKTFNNKYAICQMKLMKWKGIDKIKRKKVKALVQ
jgi:hypothetical protein